MAWLSLSVHQVVILISNYELPPGFYEVVSRSKPPIQSEFSSQKCIDNFSCLILKKTCKWPFYEPFRSYFFVGIWSHFDGRFGTDGRTDRPTEGQERGTTEHRRTGSTRTTVLLLPKSFFYSTPLASSLCGLGGHVTAVVDQSHYERQPRPVGADTFSMLVWWMYWQLKILLCTVKNRPTSRPDVAVFRPASCKDRQREQYYMYMYVDTTTYCTVVRKKGVFVGN